MFQKIRNYFDRCLTDYPLLWNTRLPWMLMALAITHLLFFGGGFISIDFSSLKNYLSVTHIGGASLYWFSVLCSIGFLLIWLVFFLRNNAFKVYYQVGKNYFLQQWTIIFIIVAGSISFFESFHAGAAVKIRTLISKETLVKEVNILNRGMSFMPVNRFDYFILNNCENDSVYYESEGLYEISPGNPNSTRVITIKPGAATRPVENTPGNIQADTTQDLVITEHDDRYYGYDTVKVRMIREALRRPDAFLFSNHCIDFLKLPSYPGFVAAKNRKATNLQWLTGNNHDSIRAIIQQTLDLFRKYSVYHSFDADSIAKMNMSVATLHLPYLDNTNSSYSHDESYNPDYGTPDPYKYQRFLLGRLNYMTGEMKGIFGLADERYHNDLNSDDREDTWIVLLYITLSLSIFLFTYRLFSRKVFMWSIVSSIIIAIVISLMSVRAQDGVTFSVAVLGVYSILIIVTLLTNAEKSGSKTLSGVSLSLLAWLLPFIVMLILVIAESNYANHSAYADEFMLREHYMQMNHPVLYWITHNTGLILWSNLLVVFLLIAFVYPPFARRWQGKAEE